jgi:hypothetical protein
MRLSKQQNEIVKKWLQDKNIPEVCTLCGTGKIHADADLLSLVVNEMGFTINFIAVICDNCMHTNLFLADPIILGKEGFDFSEPI